MPPAAARQPRCAAGRCVRARVRQKRSAAHSAAAATVAIGDERHARFAHPAGWALTRHVHAGKGVAPVITSISVASLQTRDDEFAVPAFTFNVHTPQFAGALDGDGNVAANPTHVQLVANGSTSLPGVDWNNGYMQYMACRTLGMRADAAPPLADCPAALDAHYAAMAQPGQEFDSEAYNTRNTRRLLKLCVPCAAPRAALPPRAAAAAARTAAHLLRTCSSVPTAFLLTLYALRSAGCRRATPRSTCRCGTTAGPMRRARRSWCAASRGRTSPRAPSSLI